MESLQKISSFLSDITDVSFGYNQINFIQPDDLEDGQVGYSVDPNGESLIKGKDGDWKKEWFVIATDELGDPILVDLNSQELTVLSAAHGEGSWNPFIIADSLENFKTIITLLHNVSEGRTCPVDLDKNPITEKERQYAITTIEIHNPNSEVWFWENYFENC